MNADIDNSNTPPEPPELDQIDSGDMSDTDRLRLPPHSIDAEQSVLGGLMLDNHAFEQVNDLLEEQDLYQHSHRLIWRHIQKLINLERPADVLTVADSARSAGELEELGGLDYLNSLAHNTPSAANIRAYASIVRENALRRHLLSVVDDIATQALNPQGRDARQILDEAEASLFKISQEGAKAAQEFVPISNAAEEALDLLGALQSGEASGIPTGFIDLDEKTSGLHGGDLLIVAGRPAMGKTSFSMNIVEHVAIGQKLPVAVFSMEMGATQLAHRLLGSIGMVDQQRMRTGQLLDEDWPKLTKAFQQLQEAQIFIDETPGLNPIDLRARARRLSRKFGKLGLVVVDYLQLMSSASGRVENRATEISDISRSLKGLARELNCPVIALSQLNRGLESRTNKRPIMSDLRESGAIEQDADVIIFIYRDEVYHPETPDKGTAEIILGKQRNGPIGTVRLAFAGEYTKFMNLSGYESTDYV